jgi:predicted Zn-dependent peptidase
VLTVASRTLSNGLTVLVLRLPHLHAVTESLMVRGGPRYERPEDNGLTHLVEHLLFRGTQQHPDGLSFHVAVEALGGEINGVTQRDACTVHLTVPPRNATAGLALLAESTISPLLSGIDVERDVVIEEILDTTGGDGQDLDLDNLSRQVIWRGHPMGRPVAGTLAKVEGFTTPQARAHFRQVFTAENAVLCVAGLVDEEQIFEAAARAFGPMPRGQRLSEIGPPVPVRGLPVQIHGTDDAQVSVLYTFPAPHENHPDFGALLLLRRILDDGFSSRLRQAICEQRGLAYSLGVSVDAYGDACLLDLELACAPRKVVTVIEELERTLDGLTKGPIGDDELARAKTRHVADLEFSLDDPDEIASWYGAAHLIGCNGGLGERLREVMAVTPESLQKLAQSVFDRDASLLSLMGPIKARELARLEKALLRPVGAPVVPAELDDLLAVG